MVCTQLPRGINVSRSRTLAAGVAALSALSVLVAAPARAADPVTVDVGRFPFAVAVDPGTHTAYVINKGNGQAQNGNGSLSTITSAGVSTRRVGGTPTAVAVNPTTHTVYVTVSNTESQLLAISPTGTRRFPVDNPMDVAVDSSNGTIWVLEAPRLLVRIVGKTQTTFNLTGSFPKSLAVDSQRHTPYVLSADGWVSLVIGEQVFTRKLSDRAEAMAVDENTGVVYVAHSSYFDNGVAHPALVSELTGFNLRLVDIGYQQIGGLDVDSTTGIASVSEYVVGNLAYGQLALVDGQRVKQRKIGGTPGAVAVDESDGATCVANTWSSTVSIVQGTTVQTVPVGPGPLAVATDDSAGVCYVANSRNDTVTEVPMP
jgi:DNA-binding beta-propeller fold protein YncE